MEDTGSSRNYTMHVLIILVAAILLGSPALAQDTRGKTLKHAVREAEGPQTFSSFIKEREYMNSPCEVASPEAERLLDFIEGATKDPEFDESWGRELVSRLRKGEGQYLKISQNVYLVQLGFGLSVADMKKSSFEELAWGYDLEVIEKGFLTDGTGWLLCRYGGLTRGQIVSGYNIVTYITSGGEAGVQNTSLASEAMAYTEDEIKERSFDYYCGRGETRITGIAGEIVDYRWKKTGSSGAREIEFTVIERDCDNLKSKNIKKRLGFLISKGRARPLKSMR